MRVYPPHLLAKSTFNQQTLTNSLGFTSIELMMVMAIAAILVALAAPSFQSLSQRWRLGQVSEQFKSSVLLARSEAIKRGGKVRMEKIAANEICDTSGVSTNWSCGWIIYFDANNNSKFDASNNQTDILIQSVSTPKDVSITRSKADHGFIFNQWADMRSFAPGGWTFGITDNASKPVSDQKMRKKLCIDGSVLSETPMEDKCP